MEKAYMVFSGFESGTPEWQVQTNPLSYGGYHPRSAFEPLLSLRNSLSTILPTYISTHIEYVSQMTLKLVIIKIMIKILRRRP